jgi:hypothetical protein
MSKIAKLLEEFENTQENKFVQLYKKCVEFKKANPEMDNFEIADKLCFNKNEGWVNYIPLVQTWLDMFTLDGTENEDILELMRQDMITIIAEYLEEDIEL